MPLNPLPPLKSKLPLSPQVARLNHASALVECVLFKERLRLENNRFAKLIDNDRSLTEFRKYQDEEFDPRIDAVVDVRTKIEAEIMKMI